MRIDCLAIAFSFSLISFACGKQPESPGAEAPPAPTAEAPPPAATEPAPVEPPGVPWSQKTHEQRKEYMAAVVVPKMKALFQAHDAAEFADFKCATCHGKDAQAVDFKMPNAVHPLPVQGTIEHAMQEDADTAKFMMEQVVPTMAQLLDTQPFDPATGQGFGCFNCHLKE